MLRETGKSPFLGPRELQRAFTFVGPGPILGKLAAVSQHTGVSRHVLAALAFDEYLSRHYPDVALKDEERACYLAEYPEEASEPGKQVEHGSAHA